MVSENGQAAMEICVVAGRHVLRWSMSTED